MNREVELVVAGESLRARGDRTLYWPRTGTLFVADLHLGKGASFRAAGMPVPAGSTAATLQELGKAIDETAARRVVMLGDLWHARSGRTPENVEALLRWRQERPVETLLVLGNHDRGEGWEIEAVAPGRIEEPFALHHYPVEDPNGYVLCGHLHPGVSLPGIGRRPCFWFGPATAVLPAFGELTGTMEVRPLSGDRIAVVGEGKVGLLPPGANLIGRTGRR